ncbi:MAG: thioredoxin family protein [Planctomycetaceae bacterium]
MTMQIRVFGPGCARCATLADNARTAVDRMGVDATVEEVHDLLQMVALGVMTTPTLVVDGRVVLSGQVLTPEQLEEVLAVDS